MLRIIDAWTFIRLFEKKFMLLMCATIACLSIGISLAFFYSPVDYQQGEFVRIMYIHVPCAWLSLCLYGAVTISNILFISYNNPIFDVLAYSISIPGFILTALCLITGSLWGYPIWGTFWVWDARLTFMLILCIFYFVYIIFHRSLVIEEKSTKPAALFNIVGIINLPIIKFSVDIWATLHQPASIIRSGGPSISNAMLLSLFAMLTFFILYCILMIGICFSNEFYYKKLQGIKMKKLSRFMI